MARQSFPSSVALLGLAAVFAAATSGHAARRATQAKDEFAPWMQHHFQDVLLVHEAIVRGDLKAAQASASRLAAQPDDPKMADAAKPSVGRIRAMANDIVAAKSVDIAAAAVAGLVATCGDCHVATDTRMPPPPAGVPTGFGGIVGHMASHRAGVNGLLAGLLIPSSTTWVEGATQLRGGALRKSDLPSDPKLTQKVAAADARVHQLAIEAVSTPAGDARVSLYGRMLADCAACHSLHPSIWGPTR